MAWDIEEIMPERWTDRIDRSCPYCGEEMEIRSSSGWFAVTATCSCGFQATMTPPDEISPLKGVIKEIRL